MHADQMEDVESLRAGYIGALFGIECSSRRYLYIAGCQFNHDFDVCSQTWSFLWRLFPKTTNRRWRWPRPEPICQGRSHSKRMSIMKPATRLLRAWANCTWIFTWKRWREYGADVSTGNPRVAYRETITQRADFNYTHKKTDGSARSGSLTFCE